MIDFSEVKAITIQGAEVVSIACYGDIIWKKEATARYPFVNGTWTYSDGSYIEITNGNHVHYYATGTKKYLNLSNIEQNTTNAGDTGNINSHPVWFTIPAGAECVLTVSNVSGYLNDANFRLANDTSSSTFFVGDSKSITTVTVTPENDIDIGCFFTYINKASETEFDIEFTVDGERWI